MAGGPGEIGPEGDMNLRMQAVFWLGALAFLLLFLWVFSGILLPFIMGMALAYLLDPIADRLERAGMSRFWATITIVVLSVLVFALVALLGVPLLIGQLSAFLEKLPTYAVELQALGDRFFETRIGQYFKTQNGGPSVDQIVIAGRLVGGDRARLGLGRRTGADQRRSAWSWSRRSSPSTCSTTGTG